MDIYSKTVGGHFKDLTSRMVLNWFPSTKRLLLNLVLTNYAVVMKKKSNEETHVGTFFMGWDEIPIHFTLFCSNFGSEVWTK